MLREGSETPGGSVHEGPVRHLLHAPKPKAKKTKFRDRVLLVKDSNQTLSSRIANPSHVLAAGTNDGQNNSRFRSCFYADDK